MSILITGNKGYIGSGLEGDGIDIKDGVDIVTYEATKRYDIIIHTAAKVSVTESMANPDEYVSVNVLGTLNLLKEHPEAHWIYLSTAAVYGEGETHTTDSELKPTSVYAATKLAGEFLVRSMARSWVILRLANVIGPGERGEPNVYQIFERSDILTVYGDGQQTRDFVHVDYVRKAIQKSIKLQGVYNVGSGFSRTVIEVAKKFNKPIQFAPERKGEIKKFGIIDAFDFDSLS